jgi:TonB family protein
MHGTQKHGQVISRLTKCLWALLCIAFLSTPRAFPQDTNTLPKPEAGEHKLPYQPPPPLPRAATALSGLTDLELAIKANPSGRITSVRVSKRSQAEIFDEYVRSWVETNWIMQPAKPGEPASRTFTVPIVWPKSKGSRSEKGDFPVPPYPAQFRKRGIGGIIILDVVIEPNGKITKCAVATSSGAKELDEHARKWVETKWRFEPHPDGERRHYYFPCVFALGGPNLKDYRYRWVPFKDKSGK